MKSYISERPAPPNSSVAALGCFDGVHIGHAAVISTAVSIAKEKSAVSAVCTFDLPPKNFFAEGSAPAITLPPEKKRLTEKLGADLFLSIPFDESISSLSPEAFFKKFLIDELNAVHVVCGFNYTFGKDASGNVDVLSALCKEAGIGFTCIPPVELDGVAVSSSIIRKEIEAGNITLAEKYLGHTFSISGEVVDGKKLARRLGFPTINQAFPKSSVVPARGVYVTRVGIDDDCYFGITNVGVRPTVGRRSLSAETNIFDFGGDLYGKTVRVELLRFLRPEKAFPSVEALSNQVNSDIETAKEIIKEIK
ncbi:MAG: bifunctional riboflavin kinase/FAD synthetase [Clostridia bacterium]|nr:bifunctional riboflavin kinase/FAD synthetase [Clostridia bacterium]